MNRTDIKYSLRSLMKDRSSSITGIMGYAIALTCSILIMIYIRFEVSYDSFHNNPESVYRISVRLLPEYAYMGNDLFIPTPGALRDALINEVAGVESAARYYQSSHTVEHHGNVFREPGFCYADESFLDIFNFPVLKGESSIVFRDPFAILITESMAAKYFGDDDPVGETLKIDNRYIYSIAGIIKDPPANSHITFSFLTGMQTYLRVRRSAEEKINSWTNNDFFTYVRLDNKTSPDQVSGQLDKIAAVHLEGKGQLFTGMRWALQPIRGIHLGGNGNFEPGNNSSTSILWILACTGLLIILLASLNYLNLSMARTLQRGKETGVLKIAGIGQKRLIFQLAGKSLSLSMAGVLLALLLVWLTLPFFSDLVGRDLSFAMILSPAVIVLVLSIIVIVGLIPGLVSAFTLASVNPVLLLNGQPFRVQARTKPGLLRRLIVIVQYTISIIAITFTFTIFLQINHIKKKDIGYATNDILNVFLTDPLLKENPESLLSELRGIPEIVKVALSSHLPNSVNASSLGYWEGKPEDQVQIVYNMGIDEEFIDLYEMDIVSGRGFSSRFGSDRFESCIINETAVAQAGWADPIGKRFGFSNQYKGTVIGVVRDFNFQSVNLSVEPLVIFSLGSGEYKSPTWISVTVREGTLEKALKSVTEAVKRVSPGYLNQVSVLSDRVEKMYSDEKRQFRIAMTLSIIALLLTCLGQYALLRYEIRRRTGEVVIRKINGATRLAIIRLFIGEQVRQIGIASLFGLPAAFLLGSRWLENYAFRINQGPVLFVIPLLVIFLLSLVVTIAQILRIARIKPGRGENITNLFRS
jgi:putative ABC transport system permease protein